MAQLYTVIYESHFWCSDMCRLFDAGGGRQGQVAAARLSVTLAWDRLYTSTLDGMQVRTVQ